MDEARHRSTPPQVVSIPRTRRLSLLAMVVETSHQVVLAIWTGGLALLASLVVPSLLGSMEDTATAARISLDLLGRLGLLGCGAGSFLLLTTLLMHLLGLRARGTIVGQLVLLLAMTTIAVVLQLALAPEVSRLIRLEPGLFEPGVAPAPLDRFRHLLGLYLGFVLLQAMLGLALMLGGVRRWYRYVPVRANGPDIYWP